MPNLPHISFTDLYCRVVVENIQNLNIECDFSMCVSYIIWLNVFRILEMPCCPIKILHNQRHMSLSSQVVGEHIINALRVYTTYGRFISDWCYMGFVNYCLPIIMFDSPALVWS